MDLMDVPIQLSQSESDAVKLEDRRRSWRVAGRLAEEWGEKRDYGGTGGLGRRGI